MLVHKLVVSIEALSKDQVVDGRGLRILVSGLDDTEKQVVPIFMAEVHGISIDDELLRALALNKVKEWMDQEQADTATTH